MHARRLEGKVALITGAASGIGYACARRYADEGAAVIGLDRQEAPRWESDLGAAAATRFFVGDVCDFPATERLVASIVEAFGHLDILVTAAGIASGGPVHALSIDEWDRVQDVNLKGTFLSAKAVLPIMMKQRSGSVITVASIEGLEGSEGGSAYNASKGGVVLLSKNMALDYGRLGIRVNCICPGFIETPLFDATLGNEAFAEHRARLRDHSSLGRFGQAHEIAGAAFFLASDDSSFVTGQVLVVDGGYTAGHRVGFAQLMGLE